MRVYVLDRSAFAEDWEMKGVFSTVEKAQAAAGGAEHDPSGWRGPDKDGRYDMGFWTITPFELDAESEP